MAIIQLAGYLAYITASLVLGTRLVLLWRRTREWPEATIGSSFLLAGALGYSSWLAIAVLMGAQAAPETIKLVAGLGLGVTVLGAISNGVGTVLIYRTGQLWAKAFVGVIGIGMVGSLIHYFTLPAETSTAGFWRTILVAAPLWGWGTVEALALSVALRKRARLGLADPLVADRTLQFGISSAAVVVCIAISYWAQLVYGIVPPPWAPTAAAGALLLGAASIWLGFFPPQAYRERVQRTLGVR